MPKKTKINVGILGVGEVGSSLAKIIARRHNLLVKDIERDEIKNRPLDVLHICLPYSQNFAHLVIAQIKLNRPKLTIIDSTVPLKTTEKIYQKIKPGLLIHSPIRGTHPYLARDIKKFAKFIGPTSAAAAKRAEKYYKTLGINTRTLRSCRETEMGKLLDTTYYALCIAWHQEMNRFCKKFGINFDQAVTGFNRTYNQGYKKTKTNVLRPVLFPGFIGGHCLMPNIFLLQTFLKSDFLDLIVKSNGQVK